MFLVILVVLLCFLCLFLKFFIGLIWYAIGCLVFIVMCICVCLCLLGIELGFIDLLFFVYTVLTLCVLGCVFVICVIWFRLCI